jgi:hypothetical protein
MGYKTKQKKHGRISMPKDINIKKGDKENG